jgi:hypothetical protein
MPSDKRSLIFDAVLSEAWLNSHCALWVSQLTNAHEVDNVGVKEALCRLWITRVSWHVLMKHSGYNFVKHIILRVQNQFDQARRHGIETTLQLLQRPLTFPQVLYFLEYIHAARLQQSSLSCLPDCRFLCQLTISKLTARLPPVSPRSL